MSQQKNQQGSGSQDWTQVQQRGRIRIVIWIVAVLYLCFLGYQLIRLYLQGDSGMSTPVLVIVLAAFAAAIAAIVWMAVRQWRRTEEKVARMIEEERQREEAELERQARLDVLTGNYTASSGDEDDEEEDEEGEEDGGDAQDASVPPEA